MAKTPEHKEYERSDAEFTTLIHHAFSTFPLPSYNGSDTPTTKPFIDAWADLSKNGRDTMRDLAINTKDTHENKEQIAEINELLSGKRKRHAIGKAFSSLLSEVNGTFKIKKRVKLFFGLIVALGAVGVYHLPKVFEWLAGFFK